MRSVGWCATAVVVTLAISGCVDEATPHIERSQPTVLSEPRTAISPTVASKQIGEDCSRYGESECLSGVCVNTLSAGGRRRLCSKACLSPRDCRAGWTCVRAMPGREQSICVPRVP